MKQRVQGPAEVFQLALDVVVEETLLGSLEYVQTAKKRALCPVEFLVFQGDLLPSKTIKQNYFSTITSSDKEISTYT